MSLDFAQVNWLAVVVSAIASFMVGGLWYGALFAKPWIQLQGFNEEEIKAMAAKQPRNFGIFFVGDLLMAVILSLLLAALSINSAVEAAAFGGLLWLGVLATINGSKTAAENKPLKLYLINASHELASVATMCAVLGAWR